LKKNKKKYFGKHCNNTVFYEESYSCNSQSAQYQKNKIDNDNFEKKIIRKNHMRKYCSNPQCFKEKNYKARFLISSILKKNPQRYF
jgi:hypothetical protein